MNYILLILALVSPPKYNYAKWQQSVYPLVNSIASPLYPITEIATEDDDTLHFKSYAAFKDPNNKYKAVIHNQIDIPNWALIMRIDGKRVNELSHRGIHNKVPCNVFGDDGFMFHILTNSFPYLEIMTRVWNVVSDVDNGVISYFEIDKNYDPPGIDRVSDIKIIVWVLPHPKYKDLVVVIAQGYIRSIFPLNNKKIQESLRWHINSVMENFAEKLQ